MDLAGLRTIDWYQTWNSIAVRVLKVKQSTPLADQVLQGNWDYQCSYVPSIVIAVLIL